MLTLPTSLNVVMMLPFSPLLMYSVIRALNLLLECLVDCHVVFSYDVVRGWLVLLPAVLCIVMADEA